MADQIVDHGRRDSADEAQSTLEQRTARLSASMADAPATPNTLDAILAMAFRWLGHGPDMSQLPIDENESEGAREARKRCGAQLIQLIGAMPLDHRQATSDTERQRAKREQTITDVADRALVMLDEAWKRFERLNVLATKVDRCEFGSAELATIAVDLTKAWTDDFLDTHSGLKCQLDEALGRSE